MIRTCYYILPVLCVFFALGCSLDTVVSDETIAKDFIATNTALEAAAGSVTLTINGPLGGTYSSSYQSPGTVGAKTVSTYAGYTTQDGYTIDGTIIKETTYVIMDMQIYALPSGTYSGQIAIRKDSKLIAGTIDGTWGIGGAMYLDYSERILSINGIAYPF